MSTKIQYFKKANLNRINRKGFIDLEENKPDNTVS